MATTPPPYDFRQHLEVETPEHVVLDYEIAGVGSRVLAATLDSVIVAIVLAAAALVGFWLLGSLTVGNVWGFLIVSLVLLAIFTGYFAFFEAFRHGQTPGKRMTGIRVVRDTGHPVDFSAALLRNILRIADFLPTAYFLGTLLIALHPRAKRLGDLVAGTVVVRDRPFEAEALRKPDESKPAAPLAAPELTDEEFRILGQFAARADQLAPPVRARLANGLIARFGPRLPQWRATGDDVGALLALHAEESERRRGRMGGRSTGGAGDRLAARKRERWQAFDEMARQAAEKGLDSFKAEELPNFAARYREVAADLARLRTYRADPGLVARVERAVAAGHNVLYRDERRSWRRLARLVALEAPAAVVGARRTVLLAFVLFAAPAAAGYAMLRREPALAEELVPEGMIRRAEDASAEIERGRHYAQAEAETRPIMATAIITNNVRVSFMCFAGGVLLGVGSLFLLAYNGLQLGMFAGHFANAGHLAYLLEFVAGHGVLELFAIWVAGAAGFLLGRSLWSPGELTRGDALVLNGRIALRMVVAAVMCLLVAGTIEGLLSASGIDLRARLAVSGGSAVLLVAYLTAGALYRRRMARGAAPPAAAP